MKYNERQYTLNYADCNVKDTTGKLNSFEFWSFCFISYSDKLKFDSSLEFKQIGVWDLLKLNLSLGRFFLRSRWSVIRAASFSLLSFRWRFKLLCFLRFWDDFLVLLAFACNNHWQVACIVLIYGSEDDRTFFCVFETECSCLISFECNRFGCMFSLEMKIMFDPLIMNY